MNFKIKGIIYDTNINYDDVIKITKKIFNSTYFCGVKLYFVYLL